jgi:hypothetical protein
MLAGDWRLRAIPTRYGDVEFRSKLEANVAACLDAAGVEWSYEQEGYDLAGVWYLPDFWLPRARQFVEVKGQVDDPSIEKPEALAAALGSAWGEAPRVVLVTNPFVRRCRGETNEVIGEGIYGGGERCNAALCFCHACRVAFFASLEGDHVCSACAHYQHDPPGTGDLDAIEVLVAHARGRTTYSRAR